MRSGDGAVGKLRTREAINRSGGHKSRLEDAIASHLKGVVTGSLNPEFVEWLMGFPKNWTEVEYVSGPKNRRTSRESPTASRTE
jgi:hypothetical protein